MRVERIRLDFFFVIVDGGFERGAQDGLVLALGKCQEHQELTPGEIERRRIDRHVQMKWIDHDASDHDLRLDQVGRSPEQSAQARHQFLDQERLAEVIVGTSVKALDPLHRLVSGRQYDDWSVDPCPPELRDEGQPITIRKPPVEENGIVGVLARQLAGISEPHRVVGDDALLAQSSRQGIRQFLFVFDQQKSHGQRPFHACLFYLEGCGSIAVRMIVPGNAPAIVGT